MVDPVVPVNNSTAVKYCDLPGAANHKYELAVPGTVTVTGLLEMERPVLSNPTSLMGDGLQVVGWQMADIEAVPGKAAVKPPVEPTKMSSGLVDW